MESTTKYWKYGVPICSVDSGNDTSNGGDYWKYGIPIFRYTESGGLIEGSACWGKTENVQEGNIRTFSGNWTGTGMTLGSGDSEKILLSSGNYMESEIINTGANWLSITKDKYGGSNISILKYRSASSVSDCQNASWQTYSGSFSSGGYTQIRLEHS